MGKIVQVLLYVFAFVGLVVTAACSYIYFTNQDLVTEFWSVKNDFQSVPDDRKHEVVAELPARITFEREVREDLSVLPDERQQELYKQLTKSRQTVFDGFKERIKQEAEIARKEKDATKAVSIIKETLGKVDVKVNLTGGSKPELKPKKPDPFDGLDKARDDLAKAKGKYFDAKAGSGRTKAAVDILAALDRVADEIRSLRKKSLNASQKSELDSATQDAKTTLYDTKQTPGLLSDAKAKKYLKSIPEKLSE